MLNLSALPRCRAWCRYGNVYGYMPASVARDISIVLMVAHQVIVFGLVRAADPQGTADVDRTTCAAQRMRHSIWVPLPAHVPAAAQRPSAPFLCLQFAFPIFFMAEKWAGVHTGAYWKRLLCRLPIGEWAAEPPLPGLCLRQAGVAPVLAPRCARPLRGIAPQCSAQCHSAQCAAAP